MRFPPGADRLRARLGAARSEPGRFEPDELDDAPEPARRLLRRILAPGARLFPAVELSMEGEIRLGGRWASFRADQVLRAGVGFVWRVVAGPPWLRFVGADVLGPDGARMDIRLAGVLPVVRAAGIDIERSAAGRLAGETALWVPQALVPSAGARWRPVDDRRAVVELDTPSGPIAVEVDVAEDGRLRSVLLQRWQDSADPPADTPFGGPVHDELVTRDGTRIAGRGVGGWHWGDPGWSDGEFFRYRITDVRHRA